MFADEIHRAHQKSLQVKPNTNDGLKILKGSTENLDSRKQDIVFEAGASLMKVVKGAYSCLTLVMDVGIVAFRDPYGIRSRLPFPYHISP